MPDDPPTDVDDKTLAHRMSLRGQDPQGAQEALRLLLRKYGGRVKGALAKRYRGILDDPELDQAFWDAVYHVWLAAAQFDPSVGDLGGWVFVTACRAAGSLIRGERNRRPQELLFEPSFVPADWWSGGSGLTTTWGREARLMRDMNEAIERLPRLQKAVIRADLASEEGKADARRLAEDLGSTPNAIYVARRKALVALHRMLQDKGHLPTTQRCG